MSKKVKVRSGATAPAELRGKMLTDGGSGEGTVLTSAAPTRPHAGMRANGWTSCLRTVATGCRNRGWAPNSRWTQATSP